MGRGNPDKKIRARIVSGLARPAYEKSGHGPGPDSYVYHAGRSRATPNPNPTMTFAIPICSYVIPNLLDDIIYQESLGYSQAPHYYASMNNTPPQSNFCVV